MKLLICFLIVAILIVTTLFSNDAYTGNVHQYLLREAYEYMKIHNPNVNWDATPLGMHIGTTQTGSAENPWDDGLAVIGAFREDEEDPVWQQDYPTPTLSHFWDADGSAPDDWFFCPQPSPPFNGCMANAYRKAYLYTWGNWAGTRKIFFFAENHQSGVLGFYLTWNSIFDLYNNGRYYYYGYNFLGDPYILYDPPIEYHLDPETAHRWAFLILGRIAHLLCDMSVPAHAHGDQHDMWWGGSDSYEDYMATNYTNWNRTLQPVGVNNFGPEVMINMNSINNPIRYLFYLTNQVADRFPSDDYNGDADYVSVNPSNGDNYGRYLSAIIPNINYTLYHPPSNQTLGNIANYSFCFAIKTTASLLYWFALNTNQTPGTPPVINSITCNKRDGKAFWNESLTLTGNVTGTQPISLNWNYHKCGSYNSGCQNTLPLPTGITITPGTVFVLNNSAGIGNCQSNPTQCYQTTPCSVNGYYPNCGSGNFYVAVDLVATNVFGSTTMSYSNWIIPFAAIRPPQNPPSGGCPYIYLWNNDSTNFNIENNLLNRSEFAEYRGNDIMDLYKLNCVPGQIGDKFSIQIGESENDQDYIDNTRLLAVDHPAGTVVVVTQNNQIAIYDTTVVQSSDLATQNSNNITPYIQYYYNGIKKVSGSKGDSVYAHYDSSAQSHAFSNYLKHKNGLKNTFAPDSLALISEMQSDEEWHGGGGNKNWQGVINIYTTSDSYTRPFAARQMLSSVVIPFGGISDAVNHIDVIWNADYTVSYFSVVPISFSGFTINQLSLSGAISSVDNVDVTGLLSQVDHQYLQIDSSQYVTLFFDSIGEPKSGLVRDYVFETTGHYNVLSPGTSHVMHRNSSFENINRNLTFNLYTNYPNPFNPKTVIKYEVPINTFVKITVYDILGQLVKTLVNENQSPGNYSVDFDGTNLASGMYIYKLEAGSYVNSKKMLLIK